MSKTETRLTSRVRRTGHTSFHKKTTKRNRIGGANTAEHPRLNSEKYTILEKSKDPATVNGMKMSNLNISKRGISKHTQNMPIKRGSLWPYPVTGRAVIDQRKPLMINLMSKEGLIKSPTLDVYEIILVKTNFQSSLNGVSSIDLQLYIYITVSRMIVPFFI